MLRSTVFRSSITKTFYIKPFRPLSTTTVRTSSMDRSHATGGAANSAVPGKIQEKAPKGVEKALPDSVSLLI